jgi:hypothetical protein
MSFRKHGTGEVLQPDQSDQPRTGETLLPKTAATDDPWTDQDQRELEKENEE